ncbi:hypothetical protein [Mangrovimonas sp. TPBH4]|uniref:hypothetical protein n=1 Tax=Mangrovimonas sp. TPBH4 TaxID=1645914 RepID=UPI0006B5C157|nr:hypothetical protein [Mangrovimonas sp. TPBH4]
MSDQKDAVNIGVTLSTQIIAASLTMIAVVGAFATFAIDKREIGIVYYLLTGGAFLSFVISIILGGKGIDKAREKGFIGSWTIADTKKLFDWQAKTALLGIILFSISVFNGQEKTVDLKMQIDSQENSINLLKKNIRLIIIQDSLKAIQFEQLNEKLIKTTSELEKLKLLCPTKPIEKQAPQSNKSKQ